MTGRPIPYIHDMSRIAQYTLTECANIGMSSTHVLHILSHTPKYWKHLLRAVRYNICPNLLALTLIPVSITGG